MAFTKGQFRFRLTSTIRECERLAAKIHLYWIAHIQTHTDIHEFSNILYFIWSFTKEHLINCNTGFWLLAALVSHVRFAFLPDQVLSVNFDLLCYNSLSL